MVVRWLCSSLQARSVFAQITREDWTGLQPVERTCIYERLPEPFALPGRSRVSGHQAAFHRCLVGMKSGIPTSPERPGQRRAKFFRRAMSKPIRTGSAPKVAESTRMCNAESAQGANAAVACAKGVLRHSPASSAASFTRTQFSTCRIRLMPKGTLS